VPGRRDLLPITSTASAWYAPAFGPANPGPAADGVQYHHAATGGVRASGGRSHAGAVPDRLRPAADAGSPAVAAGAQGAARAQDPRRFLRGRHVLDRAGAERRAAAVPVAAAGDVADRCGV